jgi:glutaredoxin
MFTFYLFNTFINSLEIEYVTDNEDKIQELYWKIIDDELEKYITNEGDLLSKIDWWENEYELHNELLPENIIIFDDRLGKYRINLSDNHKFFFFWNIMYTCAICPLIQLIHTNTESATAPPLKRLFFSDDSLSDCLPVMRNPMIYTHNKTEMNTPIHKPFKIISKDGCRFCVLAKDLIKTIVGDTDEEFRRYVDVVNNPPQSLVDKLKEDTKHNTYPFIFFDGKFIGGFNQLTNPQTIIKVTTIFHTKYLVDDEDDDF